MSRKKRNFDRIFDNPKVRSSIAVEVAASYVDQFDDDNADIPDMPLVMRYLQSDSEMRSATRQRLNDLGFDQALHYLSCGQRNLVWHLGTDYVVKLIPLQDVAKVLDASDHLLCLLPPVYVEPFQYNDKTSIAIMIMPKLKRFVEHDVTDMDDEKAPRVVRAIRQKYIAPLHEVCAASGYTYSDAHIRNHMFIEGDASRTPFIIDHGATEIRQPVAAEVRDSKLIEIEQRTGFQWRGKVLEHFPIYNLANPIERLNEVVRVVKEFNKYPDLSQLRDQMHLPPQL